MIAPSASPEHISAPSCMHASSVLRWRTYHNGSGAYVMQCQTCGHALRSVSKASPEVRMLSERTPFDEALLEAWEARVRRYYEDRRTGAREQHDAAWWDWYNQYLQSPAWKERRTAVLVRANYVCEGCRTWTATHVHHLSYAHVGDEMLWELVAVCQQCHQRLHPDKDL